MKAKTKKTPKCIDGKRHWWKAGWVCEKCGLTMVDLVEQMEATDEVKDESDS